MLEKKENGAYCVMGKKNEEKLVERKDEASGAYVNMH
jgi:hypothetical protein